MSSGSEVETEEKMMIYTYPGVKGLRDGDEDVFVPPCPRVNEECGGRTIELHKRDQAVRCFFLDKSTLIRCKWIVRRAVKIKPTFEGWWISDQTQAVSR